MTDNRPTWEQATRAFAQALDQERDQLTAVMNSALDEATNAQTKQENKYDTRGLEASYLAAGQGQRLLELDRLRGWIGVLAPRACETVALGTLVHLQRDDDSERWVFLAPTGGSSLVVAGTQVQVLSPDAPLGKALIALEEGEEASFADQSWEIISVTAG